MALGLRLQQKQSQSLVMTPQLAQSIKLLQLGSQELMDFVHQEIEKNPLLELDPDSSTLNKDRRDRSGENKNTDAKPQDDNPKDIGEVITNELSTNAAEKQENLDASFENVYESEGSPSDKTRNEIKEGSSGNQTQSGNSSSENLDFAASVGETVSLNQFLESQIALSFKEPENRKIATYIANCLDDDGYFRENISDAAQANEVNSEVFQTVLEKFQTLEPTGIGARNLAQCLKLQLVEKNRFDPAIAGLLENLDLLAKAEYPKLMKVCNISKEDLVDMVQEIRALDPRPAARYEAVLSEPIIADVIVNQKPDGNWSIELNPETLPKVLINRQYYNELDLAIDTDDGKEFIATCMSNASWLTKSLDQRAQTILKVSSEIVRQQDMFFVEGVEHLRPMNLKAVAEAIKMHESTVSRVTSNKYLRCNQGIFELKFFFSSSVGGADEEGGDHSSEVVKHKIKQLVDTENPRKVLSDDQIVSKLQETGIAIARRTVAKYRDALRIPSSVQRRRQKKQDFAS